MSPGFDLYRLSDDHEAIGDAVQALCEDKVAPHAAEADEKSEFPRASYDASRAVDFHASHILEAYEGAGADALATVIVIEEVARVCARAPHPCVNKLGSLPLNLAGSEDVRAAYLPASLAATPCSRTACPSPKPAAASSR